ncbi:MAG TPA: lysozyme inhibitor LprI family protein [Blastocatellia bacterium]|nr:lysozyme inhibitor LprI family protein [Blastocatellia bacterium]
MALPYLLVFLQPVIAFQIASASGYGRHQNMILSRVLFGIGFAFLFSPLVTASAQDCDHSANQREWNICTAGEAAKLDRRLDQLLAQISSRTDSARRAELARVQDKWKVFRDADCQWQAAAFAGGSIQPAVYSQCIIGLTAARIADLKLQLCEGFGVRGPCAESRRYDLSAARASARH